MLRLMRLLIRTHLASFAASASIAQQYPKSNRLGFSDRWRKRRIREKRTFEV